MSVSDDYVTRIITERSRQVNLPGTEYDIRNTPNEWTAIIAHYVTEEIRRGPNKPSREAYENSLIKAAAVIIAALEHCHIMEGNKFFDNARREN